MTESVRKIGRGAVFRWLWHVSFSRLFLYFFVMAMAILFVGMRHEFVARLESRDTMAWGSVTALLGGLVVGVAALIALWAAGIGVFARFVIRSVFGELPRH